MRDHYINHNLTRDDDIRIVLENLDGPELELELIVLWRKLEVNGCLAFLALVNRPRQRSVWLGYDLIKRDLPHLLTLLN